MTHRKFSRRFFISLGLGMLASVILMSAYGFWHKADLTFRLTVAANSTAIPATVSLCLCGLCAISRSGFFDIFKYGFCHTASILLPKKLPPHKTYLEYKAKQHSRTPLPLLPITLSGVVLFFVSIILTCFCI